MHCIRVLLAVLATASPPPRAFLRRPSSRRRASRNPCPLRRRPTPGHPSGRTRTWCGRTSGVRWTCLWRDDEAGATEAGVGLGARGSTGRGGSPTAARACRWLGRPWTAARGRCAGRAGGVQVRGRLDGGDRLGDQVERGPGHGHDCVGRLGGEGRAEKASGTCASRRSNRPRRSGLPSPASSTLPILSRRRAAAIRSRSGLT